MKEINPYILRETAQYIPFFESWHAIVFWLAVVCVVAAPVIGLSYRIIYALKSSYKSKYNFVGSNETRVFKIMAIIIGLVLFSLINLINKGEPEKYTMIHFSVLLAVGIVLFTALVYLSFIFINVYYPKLLSKKLKRLRYKPRRHPETGHKMKLLSEEEEDKYLDEGMQAEEDVFSVDYDVWIDEKTGRTIIEKYTGHLEASTCENCGFETMRLVKEEVIQSDDQFPVNSQKVRQHYRCSYCNRTEEKEIVLQKGTKDDLPDMAKEAMKKDLIQLVKVEIHSEDEQDVYDFQQIEQAIKFLQQYRERKSKDTTNLSS